MIFIKFRIIDNHPMDYREKFLTFMEMNINKMEDFLENSTFKNIAEKRSHQNVLGEILSKRRQLEQKIEKARKIEEEEAMEIEGGALQEDQAEINPTVTWDEIETAFESRIQTGLITNLGHKDIKSFFRDAGSTFIEKISDLLNTHSPLKINSTLAAEFKVVKNDEELLETKYFNTKNDQVYDSTDLDEWFLKKVQEPIEKDLEEFQERDSGWTLNSILNLTININKYNPTRGGTFITLPPEIQRKGACINIKNVMRGKQVCEDEELYNLRKERVETQCFRWSVMAGLREIQLKKRNQEKKEEE